VKDLKEEKEKIAKNYKSGIDWVYKYYVGEGKKGWRYKYKMCVLMKDVSKSLMFPVLCPSHLPTGVSSEEEEEIELPMPNEEYPKPKRSEWSYKTNYWESHIIL
jgi:hypothetical protein